MADLSDVQSAQSIKIVGSDLTGTETNPVAANASGELSTTVNNITGTIVLPTGAATEATQVAQSVLYGAVTEIAPVSDTASSGINGRLQRIAERLTSLLSITLTTPALNAQALTVRAIPFEPESYSASSIGFVPPSSATDIFTITGSATKTIRVHKIRVSGTTTSGSPVKVNFSLLRRSTVATGGTRIAVTVVKLDSNNAVGTATVGHYTANPTVGTLVGNIKGSSSAVLNSGISGGDMVWDFESDGIQHLVLRGISEQICVNLGGTTIAGPIFSVSVEWSEV